MRAWSESDGKAIHARHNDWTSDRVLTERSLANTWFLLLRNLRHTSQLGRSSVDVLGVGDYTI